ncbi:adenylosuccinate synthase [Paenibacillus sp. WQ 127069]|uniref:Adenylosuccinate synthetase n=1 Tax=Paenibacillus baimaensis TaxID=2982185 RepID=A0ABT2UQU1_9BACL|nr:adenylosuccinate synthase [Paenibacillus sp. WQ 127069]MCU6796912.1 adenylosuccinate synthase [Paenibacillus sp. WQ 127069]
MPVTAVVGANWGDEGKGKMTDAWASQSDYVVRYQGGSNAGHTIINDYGKFVLNLLPSGVFDPHVINVIGPGVALNISDLMKEWNNLQARGIPAPQLVVSERAQVLMPYHVLFDELEEARLGANSFGSTKMGISPFYADKYAKLGIQVSELYDPEHLRTRLEASLAAKNVLLQHLYGQPPVQVDELIPELMKLAAWLKPFVTDTTTMLNQALAEGKHILVEGQLGSLRDPDHGIYPFTTSSSTLAGFASVGAGIPPHSIQRVLAVVKAYSSCVGAGPFVMELEGDAAEELRKRGGDAGEYGSKTGRPRRVGWFDAVATRYGCEVQGATEVALTNLDVLGYLDEIPICTAYELDGHKTMIFPVSEQLQYANPVIETVPGWKCDISHIRRFEDLPEQAQAYVALLEKLIQTPIRWVSNGPNREQLMDRV